MAVSHEASQMSRDWFAGFQMDLKYKWWRVASFANAT